jgi:hypothetical protein
MQGCLETGIADDRFEPAEVGEERRPLVVGHIDRGVVAGVGRRRPEDEHLRAGRSQLSGGAGHVRQLIVDTVFAIEQCRHEATHDAHVEPVQELLELHGIGREIAIGPELGRTQPALDHLAQDALAVHEVAPPRRPVDAPCDRCARHPLQEITHVLTTLLPSALDVLTVRLSSWYRAVQSVAQRHADGGRPACPDPA